MRTTLLMALASFLTLSMLIPSVSAMKWMDEWTYRRPIGIVGDGTIHTNDYFQVNVSGLTLNTGNCTMEMRLVTQGNITQDFIVVDDGGQALAAGSQWCVLGFNSTVPAGGTTLYAYYDNITYIEDALYVDESLGMHHWSGMRWNVSHEYAQGGYNWTLFQPFTAGEWINQSLPEYGNRWFLNISMTAADRQGRSPPLTSQSNATAVFRMNASCLVMVDNGCWMGIGNSTHYKDITFNTTHVSTFSNGEPRYGVDGDRMQTYRIAFNGTNNVTTLWAYNVSESNATFVGNWTGINADATWNGLGIGNRGAVSASQQLYDFYGVSLSGAYGPLPVTVGAETDRTEYAFPVVASCNSTVDTPALVMSPKNESSDFGAVNSTMELRFIYSYDGADYTYNASMTNETWRICIANETANITVDGSVQYSNPSYQTRVYFFDNDILDNVTDALDLPMVVPAYAPKVVRFKVIDQFGTVQPDVIIRPQRWYWSLDQYKTVSSLLTDANGQANAYLRLDDAYYRFLLMKSGILLDVVAARTIADSGSTLVDIELTITPGALLQFPQYYGAIHGSCAYTNATGNLTCSYMDYSSDHILDYAILTVTQYRGALNASEVLYTATNTSIPNGTFTYHIGNETAYTHTHSYMLSAHVGDAEIDQFIMDMATLDYAGIGRALLFGNCLAVADWTRCGEGAVLAFFLTLTAALLGAFNPAIGITLSVVGVMASSAVGLWAVSVYNLMGMVCVAAIIIWKMSRG